MVHPKFYHISGISALLLALVLTTGCTKSEPFALLSDGACSPIQKSLVTKHINSQIEALVSGDYKKAYGYAAQSFQDSIDLLDFQIIIEAQYQVILKNKGVTFNECEIQNQEISQKVLLSNGSKDTLLTYRLTYVDNRLGVIAATATNSQSTVVT